MSEPKEQMCQWKDCTHTASKHVVCHESNELGRTSEKGYEIQLLTWHVDLCDAHLSELPSRYSISQVLGLDQACANCPNQN